MTWATKTKEIHKAYNDATCGKEIEFIKKPQKIVDIIEQVLEQSVIAKMEIEDQKFLNIETELTVVNHKNYRVVN
ncbi:DUF2187 family protein [Sporosarcina sp. FSL K6-1508]|uniref:DUF2187 family protein n=1 Tax=Sporosarcina sp. FSL K6-1508 TaxID=2921553 RepID=UPI0030F817E1